MHIKVATLLGVATFLRLCLSIFGRGGNEFGEYLVGGRLPGGVFAEILFGYYKFLAVEIEVGAVAGEAHHGAMEAVGVETNGPVAAENGGDGHTHCSVGGHHLSGGVEVVEFDITQVAHNTHQQVTIGALPSGALQVMLTRAHKGAGVGGSLAGLFFRFSDGIEQIGGTGCLGVRDKVCLHQPYGFHRVGVRNGDGFCRSFFQRFI